MLVPTCVLSVTFPSCLGASPTKLGSLIGPQYRWGSGLRWWYISSFYSHCRRVAGCPPAFPEGWCGLIHCHGLAPLQQCSLVGLYAEAAFPVALFTVCRLALLLAVPCQAQCFGLGSDGVLPWKRNSVAAALSKAPCREDVDCSSGSCISEYTA